MSRYCKTCGFRISIRQKAGGFRVDDLISVRDHRAVQPNPAQGIYLEQSPQLYLRCSVVRNGGPEDDICAGCVRVALTRLRDIIDGELQASPSAP